MRQASIGIRRQPSSEAVRQHIQHPIESTNRLSTPLPALDENYALGDIRTNNGSESTLTNPEKDHSRLGKVKSVMQTRLPFWGHKDKGKINAATTHQNDEASMNYTSDMVDVLDTIGIFDHLQPFDSYTNDYRS